MKARFSFTSSIFPPGSAGSVVANARVLWTVRTWSSPGSCQSFLICFRNNNHPGLAFDFDLTRFHNDIARHSLNRPVLNCAGMFTLSAPVALGVIQCNDA